MKHGINRILVGALAVFAAGSAAFAAPSKMIVVEKPSDLPEAAQTRSEAMYLHHTSAAQAILYLEQDQGKRLAILDVTNPAAIKTLGTVAIDAPSAYDFVQFLGANRALIHYRNHAGFAVINFKNYKQPVLIAEPEYMHPASAQADGESGWLLVSDGSSSNSSARNPQYEVLNISEKTGAKPVATISNVIQRVDRPQTGTVFLLTDQGLTVVRNLSAENEHQLQVWEKESN